MLSSLVIAFLPRSKRLFLAAVTICLFHNCAGNLLLWWFFGGWVGWDRPSCLEVSKHGFTSSAQRSHLRDWHWILGEQKVNLQVSVMFLTSAPGIGALMVAWENLGPMCCAQSLSGVRLCDPMDCSPPGSSVHGISQARILERVAISYSRGSSPPRGQICVSCISCVGRQILYHWTTRKATGRAYLSYWFWPNHLQPCNWTILGSQKEQQGLKGPSKTRWNLKALWLTWHLSLLEQLGTLLIGSDRMVIFKGKQEIMHNLLPPCSLFSWVLEMQLKKKWSPIHTPNI